MVRCTAENSMPLTWATSNPGTKRATDCWLKVPIGPNCFSAQSSNLLACGNFPSRHPRALDFQSR
eukprot:12120772-Alexandrium_andersonii.AAC.1